MVSDKKDWFIGERSEALANVLLRARNDIQIRDEKTADDGADFLVDVNQVGSRWGMLFVVQVKGTLSPDYKAWFEGAKQLFKPNENSPLIFPTCLFLFNVRDRMAFYAWVAEPLIDGDKSAKLQFAPPGEFHELDQTAVDGIVNRVREWYEALPQQLISKGA